MILVRKSWRVVKMSTNQYLVIFMSILLYDIQKHPGSIPKTKTFTTYFLSYASETFSGKDCPLFIHPRTFFFSLFWSVKIKMLLLKSNFAVRRSAFKLSFQVYKII